MDAKGIGHVQVIKPGEAFVPSPGLVIDPMTGNARPQNAEEMADAIADLIRRGSIELADQS